VGIVEYLRELIYDTATWGITVQIMEVIFNYLHIKDKVVLSPGILTDTAVGFIVVIFERNSSVIIYTKLKSFLTKLAV
jgi:hypothetical protein